MLNKKNKNIYSHSNQPIAQPRQKNSQQQRPKRTSFFNGANSNDYEDDFIEEDMSGTLRKNKEKSSSSISSNNNDNEFISNMIPIGTLGATNHMHNRINSLESEFVKMIGRDKLNEAFKILDSFKEDEIQPKLIALMGKPLYDANSGKLWLLKFCKDTAKISMR